LGLKVLKLIVKENLLLVNNLIKNIVVIILLFSAGDVFSQNDSINLKEGEWYDIFSPNIRIVRNDSVQIEINSQGEKVYERIVWLSDKMYTLQLINDYNNKTINENYGGKNVLLVEIIKIEDMCYTYKAIVKGEGFESTGKICKYVNSP